MSRNAALSLAADHGQGTFLSHIIVPDTLVECKCRALLIGWNLDSFRCCVAFAIEATSEKYIDLETSLQRSTEKLKKILRTSSKDGKAMPIILGEWVPSITGEIVNTAVAETAGIWIVLTMDNSESQPKPQLHALYSLGCLYRTSCYLVQYSKVDTNKLYCLTEEHSPPQLGIQGATSSSLYSSQLRKHALFTNLEYIVAQINVAHDLELTVKQSYCHRNVNIGLTGKSLNLSERINQLFQFIVRPFDMVETFSSWIWLKSINSIRLFLEKKHSVSNVTIVVSLWLGIRGSGSQAANTSGTSGPASGFSLCDISLSAAHIAQRFLSYECSFYKAVFFPRSWSLSVKWRKLLWFEVCTFISVTLVDMLLGTAIGYILFVNVTQIVDIVSTGSKALEQRLLLDILQWFNHSPGGIKLNPLITKKIGAFLILIISHFGRFFTWSAPAHPVLLKFIACCGGLGLSVQLDMIADIIRVFTFHIAIVHRVCALLHTYQIRLIYSLYQLFRGRKMNILRKRVDTCEYDRQQLLFGTVLFAINIFLFPSFAAYFYLFALAQLLVVLVQYLLWTVSIGIKDFPFYPILVYCLNPLGMTDGIKFEFLGPFLQQQQQQQHQQQSVSHASEGEGSIISGASVGASASHGSTRSGLSGLSSVPPSPQPGATSQQPHPPGANSSGPGARSTGRGPPRGKHVSFSFVAKIEEKNADGGQDAADGAVFSLCAGDEDGSARGAISVDQLNSHNSLQQRSQVDSKDAAHAGTMLSTPKDADRHSRYCFDFPNKLQMGAPKIESENAQTIVRSRVNQNRESEVARADANNTLETSNYGDKDNGLRKNANEAENKDNDIYGAGSDGNEPSPEGFHHHIEDPDQFLDEMCEGEENTEGVDVEGLAESDESDGQADDAKSFGGKDTGLDLYFRASYDAGEDEAEDLTSQKRFNSLDEDEEEDKSCMTSPQAGVWASEQGQQQQQQESSGAGDNRDGSAGSSRSLSERGGEAHDSPISGFEESAQQQQPVVPTALARTAQQEMTAGSSDTARLAGLRVSGEDTLVDVGGGDESSLQSILLTQLAKGASNGLPLLSSVLRQQDSFGSSSSLTMQPVGRFGLGQGQGFGNRRSVSAPSVGLLGMPRARSPRGKLPLPPQLRIPSAPLLSVRSHSHSHAIAAAGRDSSAGRVTSTTYISLTARRMPMWKLFAGFGIYWRYLVSTKGLLMRLFSGIVTGHPALDIQLIQASLDLTNPQLCRFTYPKDDFLEDVKNDAAGTAHSSMRSVSSSLSSSATNQYYASASLTQKDIKSLSRSDWDPGEALGETESSAASRDVLGAGGTGGPEMAGGASGSGSGFATAREDEKLGSSSQVDPLDLEGMSYWNAIHQRKRRDRVLWSAEMAAEVNSEERTPGQRRLSWVLFRLLMVTMMLNLSLVAGGIVIFLSDAVPARGLKMATKSVASLSPLSGGRRSGSSASKVFVDVSPSQEYDSVAGEDVIPTTAATTAIATTPPSTAAGTAAEAIALLFSNNSSSIHIEDSAVGDGVHSADGVSRSTSSSPATTATTALEPGSLAGMHLIDQPLQQMQPLPLPY